MQGLLVINKPSGVTSFFAVSKIRKITHEKRVGHTGTLDPMATGVLPVLIGRSCALSDYILHTKKVYDAEFELGITTDSFDITGNILKTSNNIPDFLKVQKTIMGFVGRYLQYPPIYSAKKVGGKKLYEIARSGGTAEIKPQEVNIIKIENIRAKSDRVISFTVTCEAGTYIRSLVSDIGERLSCGATLTKLCRTQNGVFNISQAVNLEDITEENIKSFLTPAENALPFYKSVSVSGRQAVRFFNGGALDINRLLIDNPAVGEIYKVSYNGSFIGLGKILEQSLKPVCPINKPDYIYE